MEGVSEMGCGGWMGSIHGFLGFLEELTSFVRSRQDFGTVLGTSVELVTQ